MPLGIDLRGLDNLLASFDLHEQPYYAVTIGKDLKFTNIKEGEEGGRALLESWLNVFESNGGSSPLKITYYSQLDEKGELSKKYETGSNTFKLGESFENYDRAKVGYYPRTNDLQKIVEKQSEEIEELKRLMEEEEEEGEPETVGGFSGILSGLLNNPEIQSVLIGRIMGLLDKVLPPVNNVPGVAIAGVGDEEEKINAALNVLFNSGMTANDIEKLAGIAQSNKAYFNTLLQMLRG